MSIPGDKKHTPSVEVQNVQHVESGQAVQISSSGPTLPKWITFFSFFKFLVPNYIKGKVISHYEKQELIEKVVHMIPGDTALPPHPLQDALKTFNFDQITTLKEIIDQNNEEAKLLKEYLQKAGNEQAKNH